MEFLWLFYFLLCDFLLIAPAAVLIQNTDLFKNKYYLPGGWVRTTQNHKQKILRVTLWLLWQFISSTIVPLRLCLHRRVQYIKLRNCWVISAEFTSDKSLLNKVFWMISHICPNWAYSKTDCKLCRLVQLYLVCHYKSFIPAYISILTFYSEQMDSHQLI